MSRPPLHRVRIALRAPLGTPLTSGTIFGHLCWAMRERDGEAALERWLDSQAEEPWLVSDGFPEGLLPRPLLPTPAGLPAADPRQADEAKKRRKLAWIAAAQFTAARGRLDFEELDRMLRDDPWSDEIRERYHSAPEYRRMLRDGPWRDEVPDGGAGAARTRESLQEHRLAHNTIDRHTGTTPGEGGLYFVDEDWSHVVAPNRDIYVRTIADSGHILALFETVGAFGYGRDATWGRGHFDVLAVEPAHELDDHSGNRWMSLSHGNITANMRDVRYRLFTHFGKVAPAMAHAGTRVWKLPILLTRPGATFAADGDGPFGELLNGVHQDNAGIRHDARHVAIPYTEADA